MKKPLDVEKTLFWKGPVNRQGSPLAFFLLLFTLLLFFHKPLFLGKVFHQKDILPFFYPMVSFNKEAIQAGYLPLWNPYVLSGVPHLATLEPAVFHPVSFIFYFLSFPYGYTLLLVLTYFLSSMFMYLLARNWGLSLEASLFSAIIFTYGGFTISSISYLNILFPLSWLPLVIYFFEKTLQGRSILPPLGAGMVLALQLLGGDFVPVMLTGLALVGYAGLYVRERGREIILKLIGIVSYALGFSMVQFLPTLELVQFALRSQEADYAYLTKFSFHPIRILEFFIPNLLGTLNPPESFWGRSFFSDGIVLFPSVYLGALLLPSLLLGIFSQRSKTTLFLTLSFLFSLILAMGKYTPFYYFLYETIPLFRMIPNPEKYLFWTTFAGAALAGFGADQVLKRCRVGTGYIGTFPKIRFIFPSLLLLVILDLYRVNSRVISLADETLYLERPLLVSYLEQEKSEDEPFRIYRPSPLTDIFGTASYRNMYGQRDTLESNIGMLYHISDVEGFVPAGLAHYHTILKAIELTPLPLRIKLLEMLNAAFLLTFEPLENENLEVAFLSEEPRFWVYRLKKFAPRANWVIPVAYLESKIDVLNNMIQENFDPVHHVILAPSSKSTVQNGELSTRESAVLESEKLNPVLIREYHPTRITLQTQRPTEGLLLLRETFYPGWKAFIDKTEVEIRRANYIQRAVKIPKGEHVVQFRYEPTSYKLGLFLTLLTLLISGVWICAHFFQKVRIQKRAE
ncbi:MAG TPA: YfhO family protein [Candidatus Limnocylindrales bacterium]|nr:YfhO family protein [Candidatus Limnocylindrales bacterium]